MYIVYNDKKNDSKIDETQYKDNNFKMILARMWNNKNIVFPIISGVFIFLFLLLLDGLDDEYIDSEYLSPINFEPKRIIIEPNNQNKNFQLMDKAKNMAKKLDNNHSLDNKMRIVPNKGITYPTSEIMLELDNF